MVLEVLVGAPDAIDAMDAGVAVVPIEIAPSMGVGHPMPIEKSRELGVRHLQPIDLEGRERDRMRGAFVVTAVVAAHRERTRRDADHVLGTSRGSARCEGDQQEEDQEGEWSATHGGGATGVL